MCGVCSSLIRRGYRDRTPCDPTPEEIEARAAAIAAGWPEGERLRRLGTVRKPNIDRLGGRTVRNHYPER